MNTGQKMLDSAQQLIRKTGKNMGLSEEVVERLVQPERVFEFNFEVEMDSGRKKMFIGWRIQHNNPLRPY